MNRKTVIHASFRTALSMVLFYWLALWMNWDLPKYGALAIILISVGSVGATINKSFMRMIGTTIGILVGLILVALFSQDRWLMMLAMSGYLFIVSYLMQMTSYRYALLVAGFLPAIVWSTSYMNVDEAFHFSVFRFLETAAGILVYTVVCILLWSKEEEKTVEPVSAVAKKSIHYHYLIKALFPAVCFIASFYVWIYVDPPGGSALPMMTVIFSLLALYMPMNPFQVLVVFFACTWLVVAPVYFLIMPSLSSSVGLFTLIFIYTFVCCYLGGKSMVLKMVPLVLFVMVTDITNVQMYSFIGFVNQSLVMLLSLILITIVYMLFSDIKLIKGEQI